MSDRKPLLWFDCGTTNTRLYLIDSEAKFFFCGAKAIGSRNVAIAGTRLVLVQAMADLYRDALTCFTLAQEEIACIYASGMVTSAFGLKEIPHLEVPVSPQKLRCAMEKVWVEELEREICLIPGVRSSAEDWRYMGNLRGEETEVLGAAAMLEDSGCGSDGIYILPGSHTQILYLKNGEIVDILSLFTGELFHALRTETILSHTLNQTPEDIIPEFVRRGCSDAREFGINRALYLCHSNQIFQRFVPAQLYSYAEGVILSGVYTALAQRVRQHWAKCNRIVMVCDETKWKIYGALLQGGGLPDMVWLRPSQKGCFGVKGLCGIVRK